MPIFLCIDGCPLSDFRLPQNSAIHQPGLKTKHLYICNDLKEICSNNLYIFFFSDKIHKYTETKL